MSSNNLIPTLKEYLSAILSREELLLALKYFIHNKPWINECIGQEYKQCVPFIENDSVKSCNTLKDALLQDKAKFLHQNKNSLIWGKNTIPQKKGELILKKNALMQEQNKLYMKISALSKEKAFYGREEAHLKTKIDCFNQQDDVKRLLDIGTLNNLSLLRESMIKKQNDFDFALQNATNQSIDINNMVLNIDKLLKDIEASLPCYNVIECYDSTLIKIDVLTNLLSTTIDALFMLYSVGIVHKNYRNITAISSIYDYIDIGMTYSLKRIGSDPGAYYIYDENIRANKIINAISGGFDEISSHISAIETNQQTLYTAIQHSNNILQCIQNELNLNNNLLKEKNDVLHKISSSQSASNMAMAIHNDMLHNLSNDLRTANKLNSITNAETSYFAKEIANNTRIIVDTKRDIWGNLRTIDGYIMD